MNRWLLIPAVVCAAVFAIVVAGLYQAEGREQRAAAVAYVSPDRPPTPLKVAIAPSESEQKLQALTARFLQPWRKWESSPHRLYSRVAPQPIPSIAEEIQWADSSKQPSGCRLATITITIGEQAEQTPCIVDAGSGEVRLFADGKWLAEEEWLKLAPLPHGRS